MAVQLKGMQQLLLWQLAVSEEAVWLKDLKLTVTAAERKALVREGLVREEKQRHPETGRLATCLQLDEKGWAWCQQHLGSEIDTMSKWATPILQRLLALLADYFQAQDQTRSLGHFILQARSPAADSGEAADESTAAEEGMPVEGNLAADDGQVSQRAAGDRQGTSRVSGNGAVAGRGVPADDGPAFVSRQQLEQAVRTHCLALTGGRRNVRVRLAELRPRVGVDVATLDQTLLAMERAGQLALFPLDNPQEIGPRDTEAALTTPAGHLRHIVYYEGTDG